MIARLPLAGAALLLHLAASTATAQTPRWTVSTYIDPIDDSKTVAISRRVTLPDGWSISIQVACRKGLPDLLLHNSQWVGRGTITARIRFDDAPAETEEWIAVGNAVGPAGHRAIVATIRKMLLAGKMAVRVDFGSSSPAYMATVVVPLDGFTAAFNPVAKACNWTQLYSVYP